MILKELSICDFMPYKGEQKVIFPNHDTQNVMLLFGDNMRGKTSFLNAIRWVFYGKAMGRHLRKIPRTNLVNSESAKEGNWQTSVSLTFSHEDKNYEIKRSISKKSHVSSPKRDADFNERIGLRIDGEVIAGDNIVSQINQVIPEEISRFFLFDGELLQEYENLLLEENEQGEKIKEHIEQALGVPALIHARDELGQLLKMARNVQSKDARKSSELASYAEEQKQLQSQMDDFENELSLLLDQQNQAQKKVDDIDDELKNTEIAQRKDGKIKELQSERKASENVLVDLEKEYRELLRSVWQDILYQDMSPIIQQMEKRKDVLQKSISKKAVYLFEINDLQESLNNSNCSSCGQQISNKNTDHIIKKIDQTKASLDLIKDNPDELINLNDKITSLSKIKSRGEIKRLISNVASQRKIRIEFVRIDTSLDELKDEIKGFDTEHITNQRSKRDRLIAQLGKLENDIKHVRDSINMNNKSQDHIASLISRSEFGKNQESSIRVNIYKVLWEIFSEGIERLRDSLKGEVEQFASKTFLEIISEKTYSGLNINQNYGLSIVDHQGRILNERSAGAEQIVALSLIDGLNKTARKSGPIIMDTPLGRLDPNHRMNVLNYLPNMAQQVILLVHDGEIDQSRDLGNIAERIGARYEIARISATESKLIKSN